MKGGRRSPPFFIAGEVGFRDAADQAGAGFQPTFPNRRRGRPIVAIDHVIVRDLPARAGCYAEYIAVPARAASAAAT